MTKRTFTTVFKDEACGLVTEQGYAAARAAKQLGVAEMTLRSCLKARGWRGPQQLAAPDASDDPNILKAHIRDLAKKLARSEMEKDILKKPWSFFASQTL